MIEECPCFTFGEDPDASVNDVAYCACGHAIDEHDEWGECQAAYLPAESENAMTGGRRLRAKITGRLERARAVADPSDAVPISVWEEDGFGKIRRGLEAEIARYCEADLETLAEHMPCPGGHSAEEVAFASDLMRGLRYQHHDPYCHRCLGPSPCLLLRRLGHVYGVDLDEGTATP